MRRKSIPVEEEDMEGRGRRERRISG